MGFKSLPVKIQEKNRRKQHGGGINEKKVQPLFQDLAGKAVQGREDYDLKMGSRTFFPKDDTGKILQCP